jgi:hypothetical protein
MHAMRETLSRISTQALAYARRSCTLLPAARALVLALPLGLTLLPLHSGFALGTKACGSNKQAHASSACAGCQPTYVSKRKRMQAMSMCSKALVHASLQHRMQKKKRCIAHELALFSTPFFPHTLSLQQLLLLTPYFFEFFSKNSSSAWLAPARKATATSLAASTLVLLRPPPQKKTTPTPFPTCTLN